MTSWRDDSFLTRVREHFRQSADYWADYRKEAQIDQQFKALIQWPPHIKREREMAQRPCLTFDQINPAIRQQTNIQRKANPSIQITPEHGGADEETAEVFQGIVRSIEQGPVKAAPSYDWAFEEMVSLGRGWIEVCADYQDDASRDQILVIKRKLNSFSIYSDPTAMEPDDSDARFLIEITDLPPSEYKRRYKDSSLASLTDFSALGNELPDWFPESQIRIAKYWYIDYEESELVEEGVTAKGEQKRASRPVKKPVVKVAVVNAIEVLEGNDAQTEGQLWAGKYIPVIPDTGEEYYLHGKRCFRGLIRPARDPQTTYNFERTSLTEMTALAKTAPWVADARQVEPFRSIWEAQQTTNLVYLPYETVESATGTIVPPPSRVGSNPPIEATVVGINLAKQDLRSTTNYYDPTDPSRANTEQSGRAILARKDESAENSAHFLDNHTHFLTRVGMVLVDLIPKIYDRPGRVLRIVGNDDQPKTVMLNQPFSNQQGQPQAVGPDQYQPDLHEFYDLSAGTYAVAVGVGGNYSTRRQEAADFGLKLMDALPQQAPLFAHVVVAQMDGPGHQQIANILKKALPPQFQEDTGKPQVPPEVQQQMQKAQQMMELLTKELDAKNKIIETDQIKTDADFKRAQLDNDTKVRIAGIQAEASVAAADVKSSLSDMQMRVEAMEALIGREHDVRMAQMSHQQNLDASAQAHDQQMEAGDMGHQQALEQGQQAADLAPQPEAGA